MSFNHFLIGRLQPFATSRRFTRTFFPLSLPCFVLLYSIWLLDNQKTAGSVFLQGPIANENKRQENPSGWRFVRGENFDGISNETDLLDSWPANGIPIVWHRKLGQGYSSFTGNEGRIFTQYQTLTGQYLICLDALTGETIWEYRHSWPFDPAGLYPGPQSTPTLDDEFVYFTSPKGLLGCLRQDNGQVVWQRNMFEQFDAKEVEFGYSCTPVLIDGRIFLPVGGKDSSLVALRASDGSTIWQSGNEPISHASILPIRFQNRDLLVGYFKNAIELFDAVDGKLLSSLNLSEGYDEHSAWPIYREPDLWISAPFRTGSKWLKLEGSPPKLVENFASKDMSNDVCSSVLLGSALYGFDLWDVQSKVHRPSRGLFRCMDFETGEEYWSNGSLKERRKLNADSVLSNIESSNSEAESSVSIGHAAVIIADEKLIMLSDTGELVMARASPESYQEIGRSRLLGGEICWTQPMLLNGYIYVRDHQRVVCAYIGKPDSFENSKPLISSSDLKLPVYRDWSAIILSVEPEYAMTSPSLSWLMRWYWVTLCLGWLVAPAIGWCWMGLRRVLKWASSRKFFEPVWTSSAFILGLLGTTFLSRWTGEFLFTWPLALAISFQWLMQLAKVRRDEVVPHPILSRVMLVLFVGMVFGYFLVCRRLSLAFEWCFLLGFPAAIPFLVWKKRLNVADRRFALLIAWGLTGLAYTAFYWLGAGLMLWRYPTD